MYYHLEYRKSSNKPLVGNSFNLPLGGGLLEGEGLIRVGGLLDDFTVHTVFHILFVIPKFYTGPPADSRYFEGEFCTLALKNAKIEGILFDLEILLGIWKELTIEEQR